jgi:hypothetical protein
MKNHKFGYSSDCLKSVENQPSPLIQPSIFLKYWNSNPSRDRDHTPKCRIGISKTCQKRRSIDLFSRRRHLVCAFLLSNLLKENVNLGRVRLPCGRVTTCQRVPSLSQETTNEDATPLAEMMFWLSGDILLRRRKGWKAHKPECKIIRAQRRSRAGPDDPVKKEVLTRSAGTTGYTAAVACYNILEVLREGSEECCSRLLLHLAAVKHCAIPSDREMLYYGCGVLLNLVRIVHISDDGPTFSRKMGRSGIFDIMRAY